MKISMNHSASIEQYVANEMEPSERAEFTKELSNNSELAEELKLSQSIDSALFDENIIDLRKKLIAASKKENPVKQDVPIKMMGARQWWYAAASFLVVCSIASVLYFQTNLHTSNDSLFKEYYSSENIVDQTRGDQNIVEAIVKFQQKDFKSASVLFSNILEKDKSNIAVWFYFGISNIELKKMDIAIEAFKTIIQQNDNLYIEHADWYLGLCYLKNNQKDKALDQLLKVANNPENYHHREAQKILEKVEGK